jgi:hypothetical protein
MHDFGRFVPKSLVALLIFLGDQREHLLEFT